MVWRSVFAKTDHLAVPERRIPDLLFGEREDIAGGRVGVQDAALRVEQRDPDAHVLDQPPESFFTLPQRFSGPFPLGDVQPFDEQVAAATELDHFH